MHEKSDPMTPYDIASQFGCNQDNSYLSWNPSDYGPGAVIINISHDTLRNPSFRTTRWTGDHMQLTLMSVPEDADTGLENYPHCDKFIRIEEGEGMVLMGDSPYNLYSRQPVDDKCAILIPVNTWHTLINTGDRPLKLFTIYSPAHHPPGTVHWTKRDSQADEYL